eukprot:8461086-Pyramimonas_sp.AAC.1
MVFRVSARLAQPARVVSVRSLGVFVQLAEPLPVCVCPTPGGAVRERYVALNIHTVALNIHTVALNIQAERNSSA